MMTDTLLLSPLEQLRIAVGRQSGIYVQPETNKSNKEISQAVASVINYIITDAFDLTEEESSWFSYELSQILSPISALRPQMYLAAVKKELDSSKYSNLMLNRKWQKTGKFTLLSTAKQAPIADWAEMLSEIVLVSYPDLRAGIATIVIGSLYGALLELGLTDDQQTTRKSLYLPIAVRELIGFQN